MRVGVHLSGSQPVEDSSDDIVPTLLTSTYFTVFRGSGDHPLPMGEEIIRRGSQSYQLDLLAQWKIDSLT